MSKQQKPYFKISLLSISTLLMSAPIIAAALPQIGEQFPNQTKSSIETLLTAPNFGIILGLLISPIIIRYLGKKKTVILGLFIALISGVLPSILSVYSIILLLRFIFGFGIGLFNSLAVSLIPLFYQEDELSTMMGFQAMAGSLGSAALSFLVSYLVTFGWQTTFLAYLIIIPILILFSMFVVIPKELDFPAQESTSSKKVSAINRSVIQLSLLIFILFALFLTLIIKLPEYVIIHHIGTASTVSIISGIATLVGIPVGMFYGKLHHIFQRKLLPLGMIIAALGFFILSISENLTVLIFGIILSGIGFGVAPPFIYTWTASVAPKEAINGAYTLLIIMTNIGVFFSPILMNSIGGIFNNNTPEFSFKIAATGFLILTAITTLLLKNNYQEA